MVHSLAICTHTLIYVAHSLVNPFLGVAWHNLLKPLDGAINVHNKQQEIPKPNDSEHLLIEQVDGQSTLNCVRVAFIRISVFSYSEVTQRCFLMTNTSIFD